MNWYQQAGQDPGRLFGLNLNVGDTARVAGDIAGSGFGALGRFADAFGNVYGNAMQGIAGGLAGVGKSQADAFAGYAGGLGNVANAMANERSNFYTSNAMAEAARQQALGNMGVAAFGSYGGAANSAMNAWAQNQAAYNRAASDLGAANQGALSAYGSSRNAALGNLGPAYATLGGRGAAAGVLSGLNLNMGGGFGGLGGGLGGGNAFNAYGPNGPIASGSFGGGGAGGGLSGGYSGSLSMTPTNVSPYLEPAYGGLGGLQKNLMARDITDSLNSNFGAGLKTLTDQHMSSREMPSKMLGQTLSGLLQLGDQGYSQIGRGMDQFYSVQANPENRADFREIVGRMGDGFDTSARTIGALPGQLSSLYRDTLGSGAGGLGELFDKSLGKTELFRSPLERAQDARAAEKFRIRSSLEDQMIANAKYDTDQWGRGGQAGSTYPSMMRQGTLMSIIRRYT